MSSNRLLRRCLLVPTAVGLAVLLGGCQPDLFLRFFKTSPYIGKDVINTTGEDQSLSGEIAVGERVKYEFKIKNRGEAGSEPCDVTVTETEHSATGGDWTTKYKRRGLGNLTAQVKTGYVIPDMPVGSSVKFIAIINNDDGTDGDLSTATVEGLCVASLGDPPEETEFRDVIKMSAELT